MILTVISRKTSCFSREGVPGSINFVHTFHLMLGICLLSLCQLLHEKIIIYTLLYKICIYIFMYKTKLLLGCYVAVAEKKAHRKWHCRHRFPRRKYSLCTRHDRLQLSPRLHCSPSGQPLLRQCSLQGNPLPLIYDVFSWKHLLHFIFIFLSRCQLQHGMMYLSLAPPSQTLPSLKK